MWNENIFQTSFFNPWGILIIALKQRYPEGTGGLNADLKTAPISQRFSGVKDVKNGLKLNKFTCQKFLFSNFTAHFT